MVTDYGMTVSPREPDLPEVLKVADCIPLKTIQESCGIVYSIVGEPEKIQFANRVVGIVEVCGGTIMDVVRQLKPFELAEQSKSYLLLKVEWPGFLSDPLHKQKTGSNVKKEMIK